MGLDTSRGRVVATDTSSLSLAPPARSAQREPGLVDQWLDVLNPAEEILEGLRCFKAEDPACMIAENISPHAVNTLRLKVQASAFSS